MTLALEFLALNLRFALLSPASKALALRALHDINAGLDPVNRVVMDESARFNCGGPRPDKGHASVHAVDSVHYSHHAVVYWWNAGKAFTDVTDYLSRSEGALGWCKSRKDDPHAFGPGPVVRVEAENRPGKGFVVVRVSLWE